MHQARQDRTRQVRERPKAPPVISMVEARLRQALELGERDGRPAALERLVALRQSAPEHPGPARHVALIDEVMPTGTTATECAGVSK